MFDKREKNLYADENLYDDENIPRVDLPQETDIDSGSYCECKNVEPLPESARPRKDGPGGESGK